MTSLAPHPSPQAVTTRVRDHRLLIEKVVSELWPDLPSGADWIEIAALVASGGNPRYVSPSGAEGLLQVFVELGLRHPFDPEHNLRAGISHLHVCYDKLTTTVPDDLHRLLWSFAAFHGGLRGLGFAAAALKLSHEDIPQAEWWRWVPGKFWLMHRKCSISGRYPDYHSTWDYVDKIIVLKGRRGARSLP